MVKFIVGLLVGLVAGLVAGRYLPENTKLKAPEIHTGEWKAELEKSGVVIREKAKQAGTAIADATADARITAAIKSKLATEIGAGTLTSVSVNTSEGVVTLSGTMTSNNDIIKAVDTAYGTEG